MKKIVLVLILVIIATNVTFGQEKIKGNKNVTTVKTSLDSFNTITISNDFKVDLIKSNKSSIEVETDENLHSVINFMVVDSILSISTSKKIRSKRLNITVAYSSDLNEIVLNDDAEIEGLNTLKSPAFLLQINEYSIAKLAIKSDNFTLKNNNKSRIQLRSKSKLSVESLKANLSFNESSNSDVEIKTDSLQIMMKENSFLNIEGSADFANTISLDSSNLNGNKFIVRESTSLIKDTANFSIHCIDTITIEASEKSKIELYGNPKITLNKFANTAKLFKKEL